jgi:GTP pyrophosphokinase
MRATPLPGQHEDSLLREVTQMAETREEDSLRALLDLCARYMGQGDLDLIRAAYIVAEAAHSGALRKSGEPFIEHPLAVARILAELAIDAQGIAAAVLHDTVEDTSLTLAEVEAQFGPVIATIVDGVTKFTAVEAQEPGSENGNTAPNAREVENKPIDARQVRERKKRQHVETVRKLFLAMGQDPRVVLLKLADRLHNLRTLDSMSPTQRETKARETLDIFAPLAGRIGLYIIKSELEDLAFYYLDAERYRYIAERLREEAAKREDWARRMCARMERELAAQGVSATVNWRLKHPYRAMRDGEDGGMDISLLHDLIAFRVLVNTKDDCYQALGIIHHLWHPHDDRIRDYIATPKVNGYQSFHTAVFALDNQLAQIHIRTHDMHRRAQHGVATYWLDRAAGGERIDQAVPIRGEDMPEWVTQLATWHRELNFSAAKFVEVLQGDILEEQVFVFTPKGEVRELPIGSTVLDLAYGIHTNIGDHAIGAHVQTNNKQGVLVSRFVPVDYVLHSGDVVRIMTSPEAWPDNTWRDIARSNYAREKIGRTLRVRQRMLETGEALTIGEPTAETEPEIARPVLHPSGKKAKIELARCCYPCPGDEIAGIVKGRSTVTIHRICCRTLKAALARRQATGSPHATPLDIGWIDISPIKYRVHFNIYGQDHEGLMYELSECARRMGLNVSGSHADANQARYRAAITLTLDVPPQMRVDTIQRRMVSVPGIVSVRRDTTKGCGEASA